MTARVLLIDGDDRRRDDHAMFLRSVGFDVIAAADAHGAVDVTRTSQVDVVVTDAHPRGAIDGREVARRLGTVNAQWHPRIIMLVVPDEDFPYSQAHAVGCDAVIDNRCEPAALASVIRRLVAERPRAAPVRGGRAARRAS